MGPSSPGCAPNKFLNFTNKKRTSNIQAKE